MDKNRLWKFISAIEIIIAAIVIILDLFIPTIIILGIIILSLLIRRENISTLGFMRPKGFVRMVIIILAAVVIWSLLQLGLFMPVLNHLTGSTQDLSSFENLKGNLGNLLFFLIITWTLAAFGEEIVYRGYLQRRVNDIFGENRLGIILAVGISSILFGIAHTEQGIIGVIITTLDAIFFSVLKRKFDNNLWAPILAHGISNTIGLLAFYLVGPITGFW